MRRSRVMTLAASLIVAASGASAQVTGPPIRHVAYRSSASARTSVAVGGLNGASYNPSTARLLVRGGRLRAIACTRPARTAVAPVVPTVTKAGLPGFPALNCRGLWPPTQTPVEVVFAEEERS